MPEPPRVHGLVPDGSTAGTALPFAGPSAMPPHRHWFVEWMNWSQLFALVELDDSARPARSISSALSELEVRARLRDLDVAQADIDTGLADAKARAVADRQPSRGGATPAADPAKLRRRSGR